MLLDRGRGQLASEQFNISGQVHWLQMLQPQAVPTAPGEEPLDGHAVGRAGVRVADVGREELQITPHRLSPAGAIGWGIITAGKTGQERAAGKEEKGISSVLMAKPPPGARG
jgi:hypothetical protein